MQTNPSILAPKALFRLGGCNTIYRFSLFCIWKITIYRSNTRHTFFFWSGPYINLSMETPYIKKNLSMRLISCLKSFLCMENSCINFGIQICVFFMHGISMHKKFFMHEKSPNPMHKFWWFWPIHKFMHVRALKKGMIAALVRG